MGGGWRPGIELGDLSIGKSEEVSREQQQQNNKVIVRLCELLELMGKNELLNCLDCLRVGLFLEWWRGGGWVSELSPLAGVPKNIPAYISHMYK